MTLCELICLLSVKQNEISCCISSFDQCSVFIFPRDIKGVYEIKTDKESYELSKSDTIRFERMSLRDAIRDKDGINNQATVANRLRRLTTYKERYETLFRMSKFI